MIGRKRGLPEEPRRTPPKARARSRPKRAGVVRTLVKLLLLWVVVVAVFSAAFVGVKCYGNAAPPATAVGPPWAEGLPGYARTESLTYLGLPERSVMFSADDYAAVVTQRPPAAFPYARSVRQFWGYYAAACSVTKRSYPFTASHHIMLGVVGAGFTVEQTLEGVYENTIGRLTSWLSSTDTAEDAYARRTAKEYGAFMRTGHWYDFPFGVRLTALWRETPLRGSGQIRKIERRLFLTAHYAAKAAFGWIVDKAAGAPVAPADARIYARIDHAPITAFEDARVKQVKPLGGGVHLVTLPRHEEFTKAVTALTARGVRFLDIAGNDEILITALGRAGMPAEPPGARFVASAPVLSDPTMRRFAFSVPVQSIREVSAYLARERGAIERFFDY